MNPALGVDHYENFPVASWLCPSALRPAVRAIYAFARTADDLADEGDASAPQRLAALDAFERALLGCTQASPSPASAWPQVFEPLARAIERHHLPMQPFRDLLCAFRQDVRHSASGHRYANEAELLDYCRRSANPVGRLMLHLAGMNASLDLRQSDAICTALQLINFWQDLSVDVPRGRHYLPLDAFSGHGLRPEAWPPTADDEVAAAQTMVLALCGQARKLMLEGAALACRMPGRLGWELRLVVQGGLRLLDHLETLRGASWRQRPTLGTADLGIIAWRACAMRAAP